MRMAAGKLILLPGMRLMGRLRISGKLALLFCLLAATLAPALWSAFGSVSGSSARPLLFWLTALGAVALAYLGMCFQASLSHGLRELAQLVEAVLSGNLRHQAAISGTDELAHIGHRTELMNRNLSAMVAAIRSDAELVAMAGDKLSDGTRSLSERTEQQAASLEQTSASVSELAATVQRSAPSK
ncbi:MAG: methyl-accepting chemotaxis protein [Rhodoferax sp.]|nr:methyl-accepting chemotaxis protein [Rhodoferax sp.]